MAKWIRGLLAVALIALLLWLGWSLIRGAGRVLGKSTKAAGEPDPMFREEAELPTRPPEMDAEATQQPHGTLDDHVPEVQSPVDKTAAQLAEEARARDMRGN